MKTVIPICTILFLLASCGVTPQKKTLTYQNIVILSDMSSRLNNSPQKDTAAIRQIVQYFKNECVKPGEKIGDKSSISFSAFSQSQVAASVDIGEIKDLGKRQRFINSTGEYQRNGLTQQLALFVNNVKNIYESIRNPGLDLISMLMEKIENESIIKEDTFLTNGVDTTFINYENHLYIFTDGYLEYRNKGANDQFYFGSAEIDQLRQYCTDHRLDIITALAKDQTLGLPACRNSANSSIHLHILETHERDKDSILQTYKHPTGLRDNEILKAVWQKWAAESGFKQFEWRKY